MPAEIVSHLVRRGYHGTVGCMKMVQGSPEEIQKALLDLAKKLQSPGSIATLVTTFLVFLIITTVIEYSIRIVAVNLAIVEDTGHASYTRVNGFTDDDDEPMKDPLNKGVIEVEEAYVPITASLRRTFRHLSSFGGFRARMRGFRMGVFYSIIVGVFQAIFTAFLSPVPILGLLLPRVLAAIFTCNLHAAWTFDTIATASDKGFFKRFLPRAEAKKLILPNVRLQVGLFVMIGGTVASSALCRRIAESHGINFLTATAYLMPLAVFLITLFGHIIPSYIALIRAEASLLPEDRQAIIPLDRTFGGRVSWEHNEENGVSARRAMFMKNFTLRGAYQMFDCATYKRVVAMLM